MKPWDLIPVVLLVLFGTALGGGAIMAALALHWRRGTRGGNEALASHNNPAYEIPHHQLFPSLFRRPASWLAVRSRDLSKVQTAFALSDPKPCTWAEGLADEEKLFIAPPVNGWILVTGAALPDPNEDVDACFRFVLELSRRFGEVQFFRADRVLHHHAWVRAKAGRVVRAYAWAGTTLWNQGVKTSAEVVLRMTCFGYGDASAEASWNVAEWMGANVEKVPLLAARWSLDPAGIDGRLLEHQHGVAGEPPGFS